MTDMKKWMRVLNESSMPGHVMSEQTCPLCHKMKDMCECWSAPGMMDESTCPMCEQPMDMCECSGSLGIMDEGACPTCHEHPCVCDEGNVVTGALADKSIKVGDKIPGTNLTKTKQIEDESVDPNSDHVSHGYNAALKALDDPMGIMPRNPHVHDHMTPEDEKHAQDWEKGFRAAMHGEGGMDESLTGAAGGAIAGGMMGGPLGAVAGGLLGSNLGNEKESNNSSGPTIVPIPLEEEHCMECGMPMESCTCDEGAGIMHFKDQKAKQAGKKTFALGGRTFPVKEAEDKDQNKDDGKYWDDVEREQSCTRCGGSGGLENRRTGEWQNCSSCGGSGIKSKYRHMEESEQKKKVSETANEEVLEDWNVLYDSAHAKNVRARVRLDKTMDEAAVKEWFSKTFQPMKIYELRRNSVNEETPDSNEEFKPFTLSYRDLRDGKMKRKDFHTERDWNRWYDHPRRSTDNHSYSELEEDGSTIGAPPQATNTATSSDTGAPTTNLSSTSNTPSVPQVAGAIDKDTVQKNAITIPGKQGKWLKVGEDQVEEDREKREEGDNDMTDLLARVHRVLLKKDDENVYLDVKAQIKALTQVAREEDIDLHKLKDAWFENEHGLPMGLSSLNIKNLEPSNPENPMGMGPAAGPAAGLPPMDAGAMAPPPMPAGGPAAAPPPPAPGVPPMQEAKTKQRTVDILANRPKNGVAKHGKEYKAVVTGKTASGQEFPTHLKKHYGLGGPKGKLPESAKKAVSESHAVHLEVEDHHEVRMAQADLYKMAKCATELHAMLENMSELEGWVQAKITLAADYVETVKDHIEYEMARKHEEVHADSMMSLAESKKKAKKK